MVRQRSCVAGLYYRDGLGGYRRQGSHSHSPIAHFDLWAADTVYFIRAGSFISVPVLVAAPMVFVVLFFAKMFSKIVGLLPTVRAFKYQREEGLYYTLMMSTGLTFGTISSLFGLNHGIITEGQYSFLVATVIGSAVIPTMIANAFYMPKHLLPKAPKKTEKAAVDSELLTD